MYANENIPWLGLRDPSAARRTFAACLFGIFATALLWRLGRSRGRRAQIALAAFGVSMILLYGASATYHALRLPPDRLRVFQLLDHSAIYLLIAGTYTPAFYFLLPDTPQRRLFLGGIWLLAIAGIVCKWTIPDMPYWLTVGLYIGMGWVGVLTVAEMLRAVGPAGDGLGLLGRPLVHPRRTRRPVPLAARPARPVRLARGLSPVRDGRDACVTSFSW